MLGQPLRARVGSSRRAHASVEVANVRAPPLPEPAPEPEPSPDLNVWQLQRELKKGLAHLHEQQVEQHRRFSDLGEREKRVAHLEILRARHEQLEVDHKAVLAGYDVLRRGDQLGEDVKAFLAREGKALGDMIAELLLIRRLGGSRMRQLHALNEELLDLRSRVQGVPRMNWRAPPGMVTSLSAAQLQRVNTPPPIATGLPYTPPQPRRVQSANAKGRTEPRLLPEWELQPAEAFLPSPAHLSPDGPASPTKTDISEAPTFKLESRIDELRAELKKAQAASDSYEKRCREADELINREREACKQLDEEKARLDAELKQARSGIMSVKHERDENVSALKMQIADQAKIHTARLGEFQEQYAAKVDQEQREQRVELLRRQIGRRMLFRDLARGWQAWLDMWEARLRALQWLQNAAAHFRKPELARVYFMWVNDWQEDKHAKERQALEAQYLSQTEKLVARFAKRLMQQDTARAFSSWRELQLARRRAFDMLRQGANNIRRPALSFGFYLWIEYIDEIAEAAARAAKEAREKELLGSNSVLSQELARVRATYEKRLAESQQAMADALERQHFELTASAEELAARNAKEAREQRVERMHRQWSKRMMNQDLARAFSSWAEMWEARADALERLRVAANHLRDPELAIGFSTWKELVLRRKQKQAEMREGGLRGERDALKEALLALRADSEQKLGVAAAERKMLMEKILLLGGSAAEAEANLHATQAAERAERANLLGRQITRRMMNRSLSEGWTAWVDFWESRTYARSKLTEVAMRMQRPELSNAFASWLDDFLDAKRREEIEEMQARLEVEAQRSKEALESQLRQSRFEAGQLEMLRLAHEDELRAMRDRMRAVTDDAVTKDASLTAATMLAREHEELKEAYAAAQETAEAANKGRLEAEAEIGRQRKADHELLEGLLEEQRKSISDDLANLQRELYLAEIQKGQLQRALQALSDEHVTLEGRCAEITDEYEQLREQHAALGKAKDAMRDSYEEQLAKLKKQYTDALAAQRAEHEDILQRLRREHAKALAELQSQLATQTEARLLAEEQLRQLKEETEKQLKILADEKARMSDRILFLETPPKKEASPKKPKVDPKERKRTGPLGHIDLDESPGAPPISDQIKEALRQNSGKVLDLFRSWDADGDGVVTRAEFHKSMPALGLDVAKESIDALFSSWDKDGEGTLTLKELTKILRAKSATRPGGDGPPTMASAAKTAFSAASMASLTSLMKPGGGTKP